MAMIELLETDEQEQDAYQPVHDIADDTSDVSDADREAIRHFFNELHLPVPQEGDFFHTNDGPLVPVSRYGFSVRILDQFPTTMIEATRGHDMALQPFKITPLPGGLGSIAIVPGIEALPLECENNEEVIYFLIEEAAATSLAVTEPYNNNVGILPATWQITETEDRFPAVLDYGAFHITNHALRAEFEKAAWRGIQERAFAPAKDKLLTAWPDGRSEPIYGLLQETLCYYKNIVNLPEGDRNRILVPGWLKQEGAGFKMRKAAEAARSYEHRIQDYKFAI